MKASVWDQRIERAAHLAEAHPAAAELLAFYRSIASFQKDVYTQFAASAGDGERTAGLPAVLERFPALLALVDRIGPPPLAETAHRLMQSPGDWEDLLRCCWEDHADPQAPTAAAEVFLARAVYQPFAEYLAARSDVPTSAVRKTCPFCENKPVLAVLRGEGDGAKRSLVCSLCATEWNSRRILCSSCGEEQRDNLPVFSAAEFDYIRIEACDNCRTYLKSIDLTKNGLAVPLVDEIASISLDLWAQEQGYAKLQPNLLGM